MKKPLIYFRDGWWRVSLMPTQLVHALEAISAKQGTSLEVTIAALTHRGVKEFSKLQPGEVL